MKLIAIVMSLLGKLLLKFVIKTHMSKIVFLRKFLFTSNFSCMGKIFIFGENFLFLKITIFFGKVIFSDRLGLHAWAFWMVACEFGCMHEWLEWHAWWKNMHACFCGCMQAISVKEERERECMHVVKVNWWCAHADWGAYPK